MGHNEPSLKSVNDGKREDLDPKGTTHSGFLGLYELTLRRFKAAMHALTLLPLYGLGCVLISLAVTPGIFLFQFVSVQTSSLPKLIHYPLLAFALAASYFLYGFTLIIVVPLFNFVLRTSPQEWRGPYYSTATIRWAIHNGLTYLVRYTFLEFITPSPYNILFYRLMGMKIGRGVQINSSHISDPSLIEMGNKVTIGGSATVVAHYGQGGYLVIAPVKIGDNVTIGLRATIMGGVEIGKGARVLPNSVVLPKTQIPAGETWGGVPAQKIEIRKAA